MSYQWERKLEAFPLESEMKPDVHSLHSNSIKYLILSQSNKARQINKKDTKEQRRSQIILQYIL
jgi:hypothetical protein